jgi:hypothetical protein
MSDWRKRILEQPPAMILFIVVFIGSLVGALSRHLWWSFLLALGVATAFVCITGGALYPKPTTSDQDPPATISVPELLDLVVGKGIGDLWNRLGLPFSISR